MYETIFINENTNSFYLARWLLLKKKINQTTFKEYCNMDKDELIEICNNLGYRVKEREKKKATMEPTDAKLFDDVELFD